MHSSQNIVHYLVTVQIYNIFITWVFCEKKILHQFSIICIVILSVSIWLRNMHEHSELKHTDETFQSIILPIEKHLPIWMHSLTSVNTYLTTIINFISFFNTTLHLICLSISNPLIFDMKNCETFLCIKIFIFLQLS